MTFLNCNLVICISNTVYCFKIGKLSRFTENNKPKSFLLIIVVLITMKEVMIWSARINQLFVFYIVLIAEGIGATIILLFWYSVGILEDFAHQLLLKLF